MKRKTLPYLLGTLVGVGAVILIAVLILRGLGTLVGLFLPADGKVDLAAIFAQTRHAAITPHLVFPLALGGAFFGFCALWTPRSDSRVAVCLLRVIVGGVCFVLSLLLCVLLSRVNGIRFADLLMALIPMLEVL